MVRTVSEDVLHLTNQYSWLEVEASHGLCLELEIQDINLAIGHWPNLPFINRAFDIKSLYKFHGVTASFVVLSLVLYEYLTSALWNWGRTSCGDEPVIVFTGLSLSFIIAQIKIFDGWRISRSRIVPSTSSFISKPNQLW